MKEFFNSAGIQALTFLDQGLLNWSGWAIFAFTMLATHATIAAVTIYLHRHQAHRALDLHPMVAHVFRLWLWLSTGMQTKAWAAIHRKHHAKCETPEDPHSPQTRGLKEVFWRGAELYRAEAKNIETLSKYGQGTPDDWVERHIYSRYPWQGLGIMLVINLMLFGVVGLTVWAVQMLWIPVTAAGIINGVGHYWGYRNFEASDASTNIVPWGILIGGEELHNNHHTYPTSAKLSVKPFEFDIGWLYIRLLTTFGLARVKKIPPRLTYGEAQPVVNGNTLDALIIYRYEVMANYARYLRSVCRQDIQRLQQRPAKAILSVARNYMHRDLEKVPDHAQGLLQQARVSLPQTNIMVDMREELRQFWVNTHHTKEQLIADLQAWCRRAEDSGIVALREFSLRLRAVRA